MNQPPLNPDAIRELTEAIRLTVEYVGTGMLPAIPGWSWYDAMVKYAPNDAEVLRAMDPLPEPAAALPEVTSVEEVPAKLQIISWEEEPEHECWKLAPDETFVGLIVKSGRSWTPRDKYTLNIERPEVNDA